MAPQIRASGHPRKYLYIVFSTPPDGIGVDDYERFYDTHVREIVALDGFDAGRLYGVEAREGFPYRYLAAYEMTAAPDEAFKALYRAAEEGRVALPSWFDRIPFLDWTTDGLHEGHDPLSERALTVGLFDILPASAPVYELVLQTPVEGREAIRWALISASQSEQPAAAEGLVAQVRAKALAGLVDGASHLATSDGGAGPR